MPPGCLGRLGHWLWRNFRFCLTVRTPKGLGVGSGAGDPAGLCAVATSLRIPSA